ncbi:hypothetical protein WBU86_27225 [Escherichia coli]|nr:hypothetical protein MUTS15_41010 [Escherichia coli]
MQISKNLSEIPANGETAQQAARKNIGIDGDVAYRDKGNAFTHPNTFKDDVIFEDVLSSKKQININKPGTDLTLFSFAGLSDVSGDYLDFSTRGENNQKVFIDYAEFTMMAWCYCAAGRRINTGMRLILNRLKRLTGSRRMKMAT